jgi:hypothetical protein
MAFFIANSYPVSIWSKLCASEFIVIGISNFDDKEYGAILSPRVLETI